MKRVGSIVVVVSLIAGCESKKDAGAEQSSDVLPASLLLAEAPEGALDVKSLKASAKESDTVIVRGVIGGRAEPIASNRAILTILDLSIPTCDKDGGDSCKTPWDACCEEQGTISAASATVQVVDPHGRPLRGSFSSLRGIAPLKEIIVVGKVRGPVTEKNLVIEATGIYVKG